MAIVPGTGIGYSGSVGEKVVQVDLFKEGGFELRKV
jgi:hypothetical protein